MQSRRILVLDSHPDADPGHFVHGLADAYSDAARDAGHDVRVLRLAELDVPLLRRPADWLEGEAPAPIRAVQADLAWCEHLVIIYPLWLGDVPALLKGLLEQVMRPGFALEYRDKGLPHKLLKGRSARVAVTMGMPALFYRLAYGAHSLKSLERNILRFVGFKPVEHEIFGGVEDEKNRQAALRRMAELGAAGE